MLENLKKLAENESGQGMVEYGLIIGLIAIGVIGAITLIKGGLNGIFGDVNTALTDAPTE